MTYPKTLDFTALRKHVKAYSDEELCKALDPVDDLDCIGLAHGHAVVREILRRTFEKVLAIEASII